MDDRVLHNLLISEDKCPANPVSYFMFQEDIKPYMRRIVAMWMLEVCTKSKNRCIATYFQHISHNIGLRTYYFLYAWRKKLLEFGWASQWVTQRMSLIIRS